MGQLGVGTRKAINDVTRIGRVQVLQDLLITARFDEHAIYKTAFDSAAHRAPPARNASVGVELTK
ncbi:hypothetical protein D9M68_989570 [compost metagenome]